MTYEEFLEFVPSKCMYETIYDDSEGRTILVISMLDAYGMVNKAALAQPEHEPVAWLQFRDNEPPVVAPRDLGTPVFLGIRGGLAHDAQSKEQL